MMENQTYLVDSDVFITAKNLYYAFDLCPGFWKSVITTRQAESSASTGFAANCSRATRRKILFSGVKNDVPTSFFIQVDTDVVVRAYMDIMMWVQRHPGYLDLAKAKFTTGADGWLVAYARIHATLS